MDDLIPVLTKFHRDIVLPDIERAIVASEGRVRDEMRALFDALSIRLDRLETEYQMVVAGMKRLEERLDRIDQRVEKLMLRSDLLELKARVDGLQEQVRTLEARLEE